MMYRFILLLLLLGLNVQSVFSQCAMCKMVAENGAQADGGPTLGLNQGILYLAAVPYLAFTVIAFLFWRAYKKKRKEEAEFQV